jgi:putative ABC transport system permease protein
VKYLQLIWSGLWRKPVRTAFTLLAMLVAFALFGLLQGIDVFFKQAVERGRLDVLVSANPAGLPLPLADFPQIQAVQGVKSVTYQGAPMVGYYQSPLNIVVILPVSDNFFDGPHSQFTASAEHLAAMRRMRTGALITAGLSQRLGWKVGDHVPVRVINGAKKDGSSDWSFDIAGYFDIPDNPSQDVPLLFMNYPYFDTARATDQGTVQSYIERISDASQAAVIASRIDNLFANSGSPTHTDTQRASAQAQTAQLGSLDFFADAIVAVAFATLLLLTGTTLMQSYRERIGEFAVMKTLGFRDEGIAAMVMSEAVLLSVAAAGLGLLVADGLLQLVSRLSQGVLGGLHVPGIVFWAGIGAAVLLALLCAGAPAWQARQLSIVNALATR